MRRGRDDQIILSYLRNISDVVQTRAVVLSNPEFFQSDPLFNFEKFLDQVIYVKIPVSYPITEQRECVVLSAIVTGNFLMNTANDREIFISFT